MNASCIRTLSPRLSQSLEGKVASVKSILNLKCVLNTGERLDQRVDRSDARTFSLEEKRGYKDYRTIDEGTIRYKGFDSKGNAEEGYINNFGYVSVKSVEDHTSKKTEESSLVPGINCLNLISPEHHPLFVGRAHHKYQVRFQIIGNQARVLAVASAKDIPYQALPYSLKLNGDMYGVPIGGYNINLGHIEEVVNSDWEATNILVLRALPIQDRKGYSTHTSELGIVSSYPNKENGKPVQHAEISSAFIPFKSLLESGEKQDVYPKSLFQGEWYYRQVGIAGNLSHLHEGFELGVELGHDNQFAPASRVHIVLKDDFLIGYTKNIENISTQDIVPISRERWVFKIPVQHLDYWANRSGKDLNAGLKEVPNNTQDIHKRPLVRINFSQTDTPVSKFLNKNSAFSSARLDEIKISEDYIGFSLKDDVSQSAIQFSFLRVNKNSKFKPIYMTQKMYELFPAFATKKRVDDINKYTWSDEYQKSHPVQLFDLSRPIVYHFSNLSPKSDSVRDMGREAINLWNQAFVKAGVSCPREGCVILDETKDVDVGDVRYNILNFLTPDSESGAFLGYGPSIVDFETGEIISATANIFLSHFHRYLHDMIYNYVIFRGGFIPFYQTNYAKFGTRGSSGHLKRALLSGRSLRKLFLPEYIMNSWNPHKQTYDTQSVSSTNLKPMYGLGFENGKVEYLNSIQGVLKDSKDRQALALQYEMLKGIEPEPSMSIDEIYEAIHNEHNHGKSETVNLHSCALREGYLPSGNYGYKMIDELCKEELEDVVEKGSYFIVRDLSPHKKVRWLKKQSRRESFQNKVANCAKKVLPLLYTHTTIHEIGHNFSMSHNFKASYDKENALPVTDYEYKYIFSNLNDKEAQFIKDIPAIGSSVMDYPGGLRDNFNPGGYDVAFLKFFYAGQIEHRDGSVISLDLSSKEDSDKLSSIPNYQFKKYLSCADRDVYGTDPYCATFDAGYSAEEIVDNHYNFLIADRLPLQTSGLRPSDQASGRSVYGFIDSTIGIYHEWRHEIAKHIKTDDPLLLTNIDYEDYIVQIKELVQNNEKLNDLFKARNKIILAYTGLLFDLHDKYCIIENQNKSRTLELVAFQDLHRFLSNDPQLKMEVSSCDDMNGVLARSGRMSVAEQGAPLYPGRFLTDPYYNRQVHYNFDYQGSIYPRFAGYIGLMATAYSVRDNTFLGLMDEPDVRHLVHERLLDRILRGQRISFRNQSGLQSIDTHFPNFRNEETLWNFISFPLLHRSTNPLVQMRETQGFLDEFVYMSPIEDLGDNQSIVGLDIVRYNSFRSQGAYLIEGNTELNQFSTSIILKSISNQSSRGRRLISGIRSNDLKRSFIKSGDVFYEKFVTEETRRDFKARFKEQLEHIVNIKTSIQELYQNPNPYIPVMTFISVFDYLESKKADSVLNRQLENKLVADDSIHFSMRALQAATILQFKAEKAFDRKCKELDLDKCPEINASILEDEKYSELLEGGSQIISEELKKFSTNTEDYVDSVKVNGKAFYEFSIIKPFVEQIYKNKDKSNNASDSAYVKLIQDLYALNLFSKVESEVSSKINSLFNSMIEQLARLDQSASLSQDMEKLKTNIDRLETLKPFSKNKFFQEMFTRNVHLNSSLHEPKFLSGDSTKESDLLNMLNLQDSDHSLFKPLTSISSIIEVVKNPIEISLITLSYIKQFSISVNRWSGQDETDEVVKIVQAINKDYEDTNYIEQIHRSFGSIYELFILNKVVNNLFSVFVDVAKEIVESSVAEVLKETENGVKGGLRHFMKETENESILTDFFNRQSSEDLISQYNIIYRSITPSLFLYNSLGLGESAAGHATQIQNTSEEILNLSKKWKSLNSPSKLFRQKLGH